MLYSIKNFLITFLIAAVIFGVAAYFVSSFLMNTVAEPLGVDRDKLAELLNPTGDTTPDDVQSTTDFTSEATEEVPFDTDAETDENGNPVVTENAETTLPGIDTSLITGDSFTMLFIGTDYQPDKYDDYAEDYKNKDEFEYGALTENIRYTGAKMLMLMRFDKENGRIIYLPIPANMSLIVGTQYFTLERLYSNCGRDWIISKINALTGMNIDYYTVVNITDMPAIIAAVGEFSYTVPYDVYDTEQGYVRTLPEGTESAPVLLAGKQKIEESMSVPLLAFDDYPKGSTEQLAFFTSFMKALMAQITDPSRKGEATEFFSAIKNEADTDFTVAEMSKNLELIFSYNSFNVETLTYPGTYAKNEAGDTVFKPDTAGAVAMLAAYK